MHVYDMELRGSYMFGNLFLPKWKNESHIILWKHNTNYLQLDNIFLIYFFSVIWKIID